MSNTPLVFVSSALKDRTLLLAFKEQLEQRNLFAREGLELTPDEYEDTDFSSCILVVLLSPNAMHDENVQADIAFAVGNKMKIVPVKIADCEPPELLKNIIPFQYQDFFSRQYDNFLKLAGLYHLFNLQAAPPPSITSPSFDFDKLAGNSKFYGEKEVGNIPAGESGKSLLTRIMEAVNPFKKTKEKSIFDGLDNILGSIAGSPAGSKPTGTGFPSNNHQTSSGSEPPEEEGFRPFEKIDTTSSKKSNKGRGNAVVGGVNISDFFPNEEIPVPPPVATQGKGKVLYDIPDSMTVNVQHKCVVRVGKNEAIVLDDDSFSPAVQIETIPISKVMEVDMVDISDPPRFNIKKISWVEQLVDEDSYSEWIFMVTPLSGGVYPLLLKVSVIKVIDGKERRKELVFTRSININTAVAVTEPSPLMMGLVGQHSSALTKEPELKELIKEKDVKELEPPSVFISYAHLDKTYFDIFIQYLQTHSGWNIWTDRNIEIGSDWFQSIQSSIKDSDIAVLLISANFISSGFIKEHEFHQFSSLQAAKPGFKFLPVLLRDVDFTRWEDLAKMQLFVANGDEYGVPDKKGVMIPFAKLCRFDNNGQLIPNDNIDTYFKNMVKKAEKDWLISRV